MGVTTFAIFASIVVLHFHHHDSRRPLPCYYRYVLLGFLAPATGVGLPLCKKNKGVTRKVYPDQDNTNDVVGDGMQDPDLMGAEQPGKFAQEWQQTACALNRFFFLAYICMTVVLSYIIYAARNSSA